MSHPSTSTLPPVPHDHQNAPTARKEKRAEAAISRNASTPFNTTEIVKGEVTTSRIRRSGKVTLTRQMASPSDSR